MSMFKKTRLLRVHFVSLFSVALLLACDSRPRIESDRLPFSAAKVHLGMSKDAAKALVSLDECSQDREDLASCRYAPRDARLHFMGNRVDAVYFGLLRPYDSIDKISIDSSGDFIYEHVIETNWNLKGRCLHSFSALDLAGFSSDAKLVVDMLLELRVYPAGPNDASCMGKEGQLVLVSNDEYKGGRTQRIEMFRASAATAGLFERALEYQSRSGSVILN